MNKITLIDVARFCHVDISTASRALRSDPRVKSKTQELVKKAANRLGYRPNLLAKSLAGGKTNTLWVILPSIDSIVDAKLVHEISRYANSLDYSLFAAFHDSEEFGVSKGNPIDHYVKIVDSACQGLVDGAIVLPRRFADDSDILNTFVKNEFPFVFVDNYLEGVPTSVAMTDQKQATESLIQHCLQAGAKEFILLFGNDTNPVESRRLTSSRDYLIRQRIPFTEICEIQKTWKPKKKGSPALAVLGSSQAIFHTYLAEHFSPFLQHKLVFGVFDEWIGEPSPAQKVFVGIQNSEKLAKEAVDLLIKKIQRKNKSPKEIKRIPLVECRAILPSIRC